MRESACARWEPGLLEKAAFLKRPDVYPSAPRVVEVVETHMAWVFLTDRHAWKLKKPVKTRFLDFSTSEKRRVDCQAEVRLNQRLAPGVYLRVVPLVVDEAGSLILNGRGRTVDWLVQMRRLEKDGDLESRIQSGTVTEGAIREVASLLATFYQEADAVPMNADVYVDQFAKSIEETRQDLLSPPFDLSSELVERITTTQRSFLDEQATLLVARAEEGRIIEAHGDLRPEHIWLSGSAGSHSFSTALNASIRNLFATFDKTPGTSIVLKDAEIRCPLVGTAHRRASSRSPPRETCPRPA
jgi:uncharacterized protein